MFFAFFVKFVGDADEGDNRNNGPSDLKGKGKPAVFGKESNSHKDGGNEVEDLVKDAVFDFVGREKEVGEEGHDGANPADDVVKECHKIILAQK